MTLSRTSLILGAVAVVLAAGLAQATPIVVPNGGFESSIPGPMVATNTVQVNSLAPNYWIDPPPASPYGGNFGVGSLIILGNQGGLSTQSAAEGNNFVSIWPGSKGDVTGALNPAHVWATGLQNSALTVVGTTYQATVSVGEPNFDSPVGSPIFTVSLVDVNPNYVAEGTNLYTVVATGAPFTAGTRGTWSDASSLSWTATAAGHGLEIQVDVTGFSQAGIWTANQAMLDNFRLEATPAPEPSMMALLATGPIGLLAYAWRRRRA
jgi:hypothetical protein